MLSGRPAAEAPRARRTWRHGHDVTLEDIAYRVLLESLGWTQARAGAFLGVSRQTSNAFATGRRAAPAAALKLLQVVLYCRLTMSREHYNRLVQACDLSDIETGA